MAYLWDERWKPVNLIHIPAGTCPLKYSLFMTKCVPFELVASVLPICCFHLRILPSVVHFWRFYQDTSQVFPLLSNLGVKQQLVVILLKGKIVHAIALFQEKHFLPVRLKH